MELTLILPFDIVYIQDIFILKSFRLKKLILRIANSIARLPLQTNLILSWIHWTRILSTTSLSHKRSLDAYYTWITHLSKIPNYKVLAIWIPQCYLASIVDTSMFGNPIVADRQWLPRKIISTIKQLLQNQLGTNLGLLHI